MMIHNDGWEMELNNDGLGEKILSELVHTIGKFPNKLERWSEGSAERPSSFVVSKAFLNHAAKPESRGIEWSKLPTRLGVGIAAW